MSVFELGKRIFAKKVAQVSEAQNALPRVDTDLPYGAQIGSLLEIPRASFAVLDGSLLKVPASAQMQIQAVSRIRLAADASVELYRLYTNVGDTRTGAGKAFLQVLTQNGQPVEVAYFQHLLRLIPTTAEEQAAYLGNGFGLGQQWYNLGTDQLELAGLTETQIMAVLRDAETLDFERDTPVDIDYVKPYAGVENRLDDPTGVKGMRQKVHFMPYLRELPDGNRESLLITFNAVESVDGSSMPAVHVDFMAGLTLEPLKVKVL